MDFFYHWIIEFVDFLILGLLDFWNSGGRGIEQPGGSQGQPGAARRQPGPQGCSGPIEIIDPALGPQGPQGRSGPVEIMGPQD